MWLNFQGVFKGNVEGVNFFFVTDNVTCVLTEKNNKNSASETVDRLSTKLYLCKTIFF